MTPQRGMIKDPGGQAMTHTVKLTDEVYDELTKMLRPRETFSRAISRLIGSYKPGPEDLYLRGR